MRTNRGPQEIVDSIWIRYPLAQRLVDSGAKCLITCLDRDDLGTEAADTINVRGLSLHVDSTHEHAAG